MGVNVTVNDTRFNPSIFSYIGGILALFAKIIGYLMYLFSITVLLIPSLRSGNLNWAFIFIIGGFLLNKFSGYIFSNYGPSILEITKEKFIFRPPNILRAIFGGKKSFDRKLILHYERRDPKLNNIIPLNYSIFTTDSKFGVNTIRWKNSENLTVILSELGKERYNVYVKNAFYKNTINNTIRSILKTTQGKVGAIILVIYFTMAILGGISYILAPPNPNRLYSLFFFNPDYVLFFYFTDFGTLNPPNSLFWFGTDYGGRDIFARMIFGTTFTLGIAFIAAAITTLLVTIIGLSSAIYGGTWDSIITRLSDVLLTFPQVVWIVLISVFSTPFRASGIPGSFYLAVYVGMSLVMWPFGARLVRSEVLEALNAEYVQAVELVGAKRWWIIKKHIFPKVIPTVFLLFFYSLTDIIIGISLLGYLGFGSESTIVWGSDLSKAFFGIRDAANIQNEWWTILFPSLFIFGIVLGLTLFSDALRDVYASKFRGGRGTLHSSMGGSEE